ncbi:hypothetical protein [Bacillus sp. 2205SS5-2]|uniref:hypothetical protein n=1 Tax=Bacillus sp. 2205SS5-2 TaxID=3109031 RepID=UPI00300618BF
MNYYRNLVLTIAILLIFGWCMSSLYSAYLGFAEIIKDPDPPWIVEINVFPIFLMLLIAGIMPVILLKKKKKTNSWSKALLLPIEFEECDEREKQITAQACRSSYISMWYIFPVLTALLLLYPFVSDWIPYFPVLVFLLFPLTQILAYFFTLKRYY